MRTAGKRLRARASAAVGIIGGVGVLLGATLALLADMVAQMPGAQTVLPVNVVTSLLGVPVVVWVLMRQQKMHLSG